MSALALLLAAQISMSHGHAVSPPPRAHQGSAAFGRGLAYLGGIAFVTEAPPAPEDAPALSTPRGPQLASDGYYTYSPSPRFVRPPHFRLHGTQAKIIYLRPHRGRGGSRIVFGAS